MKQKITKYTFSISTVALAVASTSAIASVDFHGYMRAGIGQNVDGGGQLCYGNGGGDMHRVGRLGDECDMYAELSLGKTVYEKDGKRFKVVSTVALGTHEDLSDTRGNSWEGNGGSAANPWEGGRASVREMYGAMSGVIGDSTIKMGKFFGQRKDVHIQASWIRLKATSRKSTPSPFGQCITGTNT